MNLILVVRIKDSRLYLFLFFLKSTIERKEKGEKHKKKLSKKT